MLKKETKVQLEYPLSELKQIGCICKWQSSSKEVQCSPLPQKVLKERSEGYRSQGSSTVVAGSKTVWQGAFDNRLQQGFLFQTKNMGFYLWE